MPTSTIDPIAPADYPSFGPGASSAPRMPAAWSGVALLHPFSPPLSTDPQPLTPFFQLCVANLACVAGEYFSAQIAGCDYGSWWYVITPGGTCLSLDKGVTWRRVEMGWTLPDSWFGSQGELAACAGSSPLNWMAGPTLDWWKIPVHAPGDAATAATWMWFDSSSGAPVRMMFGEGPPSPSMGDPSQLALLQMYSMSYLPVFAQEAPRELPAAWIDPAFPGFQVGNPNGYANFTWNANFGMTAFMTPVNQAFNPLPTRVLYVWKGDADYHVPSDRSQHSKMLYTYNPGSGQALDVQEALLTGPAPAGMQAPAGSARSYLVNYQRDGERTCADGPGFQFPQEPPTWISTPAVQARLCATISDNAVLCPDTTVTVFSVLFPPSLPNYPEATYLWVWYAPLDATGQRSRPVTFMQSQSGIGKGTSLALADYFHYQEFDQPIDPANFVAPSFCPLPRARMAARRRRFAAWTACDDA